MENIIDKKDKTLYLTLKKQWFDMINDGIKTEEYREIKPYWVKRLEGRKYDIVEFRNGYQKDAQKMRFKIEEISIAIVQPRGLQIGTMSGSFSGIFHGVVKVCSNISILGSEVNAVIGRSCFLGKVKSSNSDIKQGQGIGFANHQFNRFGFAGFCFGCFCSSSSFFCFGCFGSIIVTTASAQGQAQYKCQEQG